MRILRIDSDDPTAEVSYAAVVCHDVRNPAHRNELLARKGTLLDPDQIHQLMARNVGDVHLAVPDDGDLNENAAAARLGAAIAGSGVQVGEARFGQASLTTATRGLLRVQASSLERVNAQEGVLVLTAEPNRPVDSATTIGVVKCAPLFLPERIVREVESTVIMSGPVVEVQPFVATRVALVAPAERLRGAALERARAALANALEWYGSSLDAVLATEVTREALGTAYQQAAESRVGLILAAGAAGTDPLDVVFDGLRHAGGQVEQIGVPAEPGTACWIGRLGSTPVLGLASCELFGQPGALDLVFPRLLTGEKLDRGFLRSLALGGLLLGPSRIAPYHATGATAE